MKRPLTLALILLGSTVWACGQQSPLPPMVTPPDQNSSAETMVGEVVTAGPTISRLESLPRYAHKMTPSEDSWPPIVSEGLGQPQPLEATINTAGAEDSPFIMLDGRSLYFFFTPDVSIPPEKQLLDGVTGIWKSNWTGSAWDEPERVRLIEPGELSLDGCEFVLGDQIWFCSARVGNKRDIDLYTAVFKNGSWADWQNAGEQINLDYEVGEMHITADGQTMVFASQRAGGAGGYDLWISTKTGDSWDAPLNLGSPVNSTDDENRPYLSPDGQTLWYDSTSLKGLPGPAIFRSIRQADGTWSQPEEMVSQFAGEPNLTADGHTLFFVHHYFSTDLKTMFEADIYSVTVP